MKKQLRFFGVACLTHAYRFQRCVQSLASCSPASNPAPNSSCTRIPNRFSKRVKCVTEWIGAWYFMHSRFAYIGTYTLWAYYAAKHSYLHFPVLSLFCLHLHLEMAGNGERHAPGERTAIATNNCTLLFMKFQLIHHHSPSFTPPAFAHFPRNIVHFPLDSLAARDQT
jgi:hypothetical protein